MKGLEIDTNILISVNDQYQIEVRNEAKNHVGVHLPDWDLVSTSGFHKKISLKQINRLLNHINVLATIYINKQRVFTLGNKQVFGLLNLKLAFFYFKNIFTGK